MNSFEWFLLIVVVIVVPLTIAVVVTLWTIDQANKRKRANRKDPKIGVKRKAALSPEEVEARKAARAEKAEAETEGEDHDNNRSDPSTITPTAHLDEMAPAQTLDDQMDEQVDTADLEESAATSNKPTANS